MAFTDGTFLLLTGDYPRLRTSVEMNIPTDLDTQDLICEAELVSRETLDKFNKFHEDRRAKFKKESEIEQLQKLLEKYPEYQ